MSWIEKRDCEKSFKIKTIDKKFADIPKGSRMLIASPPIIDEYVKSILYGEFIEPVKMRDEYGQKPRNVIMNYGKQFKKACRHLSIRGKTLHSLRHTYAVRRWAITGDIKMVADEIGHTSVVMTEKYAKCNLRRLKDDFPSLAGRIALRLTPPMEDSYFTNLLQSI